MSTENLDVDAIAELRKKRQFKKFTYRGYEVAQLLDMSKEEFINTVHARARRRLLRGLNSKCQNLIKKIKKSKEACGALDKPKPIKTHLRNMIITPEMVGGQVAVYNGKAFGLVEIKADMIGYYLGEFSISYKVVSHGRPGLGASTMAKFIPLK